MRVSFDRQPSERCHGSTVLVLSFLVCAETQWVYIECNPVFFLGVNLPCVERYEGFILIQLPVPIRELVVVWCSRHLTCLESR